MVAIVAIAAIIASIASAFAFAQVPADDKQIVGYLDLPATQFLPSPQQTFSGWGLGKNGLDRIEIVVDGKHRFAARTGIPRGDVKSLFPDYPNNGNPGFELVANLGSLPLGSHDIEAIATDKSGAFKSLGKRTYVNDRFRETWSDLLAERGRKPGNVDDIFYYAFGTSNLSAVDSNQVAVQYAPYISDTVKIGVRIPILYMRTTKGRDNDWIFDPDFDTYRKCGTRRITEDSLGITIAWSIRNRIPVLFTLNGGIWADAACDIPEWDINDELEKDKNNCQWNEHDEVMADDYLKTLPGSQDAPELARALTMNVYVPEVRRYKKRNLQAAARLIRDFATAYPDLFIGVSLDPDLYQNPFFEGRQWYDYNASTIRQFREWLRGTGAYAGKGGPNVPDLSGYRRKKALTLKGVSALAMKKFSTWDDVGPSRNFALSREALTTPWGALWEQFRRHLVDLHYDELSQWVAETGIPTARIFSTQGFDAPHEVTNFEPFAIYIDSPPKHFDTGGVSVQGAVPAHGHLGATLYGEAAINNALMETPDPLFRVFRDLDPGWAILEYNTADVRGPKVVPDIIRGYRGVRDIFNYGAKLLSPMAWNGSFAGAFNEPGFVSYSSYRGSTLERAVKNAMVNRANLPRQARLWTFGGGMLIDDDDWYPQVAGMASPIDAALEVTIQDGGTVVDSPNALDFRTSELDALILGIRSAPAGASIEVQTRERDQRKWRKAVGRKTIGSLQRYRAGYLVPLPHAHSTRQIEQLRLVFRGPAGEKIIIERIALYPVALHRADSRR